MARKKHKKSRSNLDQEESGRLRLFSAMKDETRYGIWAVVFFVLAIFFVLASFSAAGPAGQKTFSILHFLFGGGFYLVPLVFVFLGISFLRSTRPNFVVLRLLAGLILVLTGLATSSSLIGGSGGWVGGLVAKPFISWFDLYASLIIFGALTVISLLVLFDTNLSLEPTIFGFRLWGRQPTDGMDDLTETGIAEEVYEETIKLAPTSPPVETPIAESIKKEDSAASFISLGRLKPRGGFTPPPLSLLEKDSGRPGVGDIKANANIIKRTLANFGIVVEMDEVSIGPSITRYALKPAEGVRLAKILTLQRDLELALAAHPLRIEAPIPGKSLVGIEIPNTTKTTVGLGTLLGTNEFANSATPLLIALGRGISGLAHYANLGKAPHLLIAGATGSGKSVMIHTLITSLLYREPPENLRFIMIDPKRVELTMYNKIPHLLTPVITDPKKAIAALRWAASEMDRRYGILEAEAVRDVDSYHKNVVARSADPEVERMPYLIIVIDELADIMSLYPRELEAAVVRLAQMSRAVGIHLVISTQRPSVEVITGLIKVNIPARIALQVASQIDSRTILDMAGAEKLLGAGDMLYLGAEMGKPVRLQAAFISETEVKKVAKFLADQYEDLPPSEIALPEGTLSGRGLFGSALDGEGGDDDEMYEAARAAVLEAGKASASYLQRKLKVGYARAARLLDMLEERGVIGPGEGAKPREVYGTAERHDYESLADAD